ncbi:MAG: ThiF family adenylyltransferase, partial [Acidobacteriota bacterium]
MSGDSRYSRQELFPGLGAAGQAALRRAGVCVVGCGALGAAQADLLVRAGVGRMRIVDRDLVELSNLQRQVLFTEADAAASLPKAVAAAERLRCVNGEVCIEPRVVDLRPGNAETLLEGLDLILDGTDNFETRYVINDVAVKSGRPWIYGACVGAYGVLMVIRPGITACLRCLMDRPPAPGTTPTCDTAGVIGPIVTAVAACQAAEALKLLSGRPDEIRRDLLALDLWRGSQQSIEVPRNPSCAACGEGRYEHLEGRHAPGLTSLCGRDAVQISPPGPAAAIDLAALARRMEGAGEVTVNPYFVRLRVGEIQLTVFGDGRGIV